MATRSLAARLSLAGFVALFFAIAFSYIVRSGRLTLVPIYDDVSYLNDAISRLTYMDAGGILGFLNTFTFMPVHSPVLAIIGTLGFLFGAEQFGAPYAFNAIWLVVMALLAWRVLKGLPDWSRVGIIVAMFAAPMFGYLISEFRPDIGWGLLVGFCAAILATFDIGAIRHRDAFSFGLLMGVALLTKPTGLPAAAVILGTAMMLQFGACYLLERPTRAASFISRFTLMTAGALSLIVPYLIFNWEHVWNYIYAALVTDKEIWTTHASLLGHIVFYLTRESGMFLLGWIWYACVPIWIACIAVLWYRKRHATLLRFVALLLTVFVAYAVPTASVMKTFHIGSIFNGPVIAATVWALGAIATTLALPSRLVAALGALIFVVAWTPKAGNLGHDNPTMNVISAVNRAIFPTIIEKMKSRTPNQPPVTLLFTVPGPAYDATIDFWARQQRVFGTYLIGYNWKSWEDFATAISRSDIVVAADPGTIGQPDSFTFPSVGFQSRVIETLQNDPAFEAQRSYTDMNGHSVWLFIRKTSFRS